LHSESCLLAALCFGSRLKRVGNLKNDALSSAGSSKLTRGLLADGWYRRTVSRSRATGHGECGLNRSARRRRARRAFALEARWRAFLRLGPCLSNSRAAVVELH
jgi:hypothetical protein